MEKPIGLGVFFFERQHCHSTVPGKFWPATSDLVCKFRLIGFGGLRSKDSFDGCKNRCSMSTQVSPDCFRAEPNTPSVFFVTLFTISYCRHWQWRHWKRWQRFFALEGRVSSNDFFSRKVTLIGLALVTLDLIDGAVTGCTSVNDWLERRF